MMAASVELVLQAASSQTPQHTWRLRALHPDRRWSSCVISVLMRQHATEMTVLDTLMLFTQRLDRQIRAVRTNVDRER